MAIVSSRIINRRFSTFVKNTVYDRVFDYVYGDVNDLETDAEIIDADEKALKTDVQSDFPGSSQP